MTVREWNGVRFDESSKRGHSESYFLKMNEPSGRRALWLKATILKKLRAAPVAETWAIAFDREGGNVATKEVLPYSEATFSKHRFDVRAGRVSFTDGRVEGAVAKGGREIAWEIDFTTDAPPLVLFPDERLYSDRLPFWKVVSPHPDSRFTGAYRVDGEEIAVDGWRGMQGHNWGRKHTELYAWGHCNEWEGAEAEELVFEGFSGRPKVGPLMTPTVSMFFVIHRGVRYGFNSPADLRRTRAVTTTRTWEFSAESRLARVEGSVKGDLEQFVGLRYENPNGETTFCLNSKIADARLRFEAKGRPPVLATTRCMAFEVGTKDPSHGVRLQA